jgi:hypothetical protein
MEIGMETAIYIAAAVIGLVSILFMLGAAKVAAESDRQSETLWRLISNNRFPSDGA